MTPIEEAYLQGFMDKCAEYGIKEAARGDMARKLLNMLDIKDYNILLPHDYAGAFMYGSDLKNALKQPKGDVHEGLLKDVVSIIKRMKKDTVIEPINRTSLAEKLRDARIFHGSAPNYLSPANKIKWDDSLQEYLKDVTNTHNKYKDKVPKGKRVLRED